MIVSLERFSGTQGDWNRIVSGLPHHNVYQSWAWGESKAHSGFRPLRYLARDAGGAALASAQVLERRLPLGAGRVWWLPGGPLALEPNGYLSVLRQLTGMARRCRSVLVAAPVHSRQDPREAVLPAAGYVEAGFYASSRATFRVSLEGTEEEILARAHSGWRHNLRKGERLGVAVRRGVSLAEQEVCLALYRETAGREGFHADLDRDTLAALLAASGAGQDTCIFVAGHEGRDLAAVLVTLIGREARWVWAGSSTEGRKVMPSEVLHWAVMRWARSQGARYYDLHGASAPGTGLYNYKKRLGGELVELAGTWIPRPAGLRERLILALLARKFASPSREPEDEA